MHAANHFISALIVGLLLAALCAALLAVVVWGPPPAAYVRIGFAVGFLSYFWVMRWSLK